MDKQPTNTDRNKINESSKFMRCSCGKVHVVVGSINDSRPTCQNCGGVDFTPVERGTAGYMPEYCDQKKDKNIWNGVMAVVLGPIHEWKDRMQDKYHFKFSKADLQDLAQSITVVGKNMINVTRDAFVKDSFVNMMQGKFSSFLYSRKRRNNQTK